MGNGLGDILFFISFKHLTLRLFIMTLFTLYQKGQVNILFDVIEKKSYMENRPTVQNIDHIH